MSLNRQYLNIKAVRRLVTTSFTARLRQGSHPTQHRTLGIAWLHNHTIGTNRLQHHSSFKLCILVSHMHRIDF